MRFTGGAVVAVAGLLVAVGAVYFIRKKSKEAGEALGAVIDAVNPASDKNLAYRSAVGLVGAENFASASDGFFGAVDLLNPFNESDSYAESLVRGNINFIKDIFGGESVSPWYSGYHMESWELDNPFGSAPALSSSPFSYVRDKLSGDGMRDKLTYRDFLPWNAFGNMVSGL